MSGKHRKRSRRGNHEGSIIKRTDGRYQASIMVDGKRKYYYSYKKSDCVNWLTEIRARLMQGRPITDAETILIVWLQHYMNAYCKGYVRPSTLANYICYTEKHIASHSIAQVKLNRLTTDHVQVFLNDLRRLDNGGALKSHTIKNIWLFLSSALTCAENCGLVWRNVAKGAKLKKPDAEKRPFLTDEDIRKLIRAAGNHPWALSIAILSSEGLRISELLALRHSSIIVEDGVLCFNITHALKREYNFDAKPGDPKTVLRLSEPKTAASIRKVPIVPAIVEKLDEHISAQKEQAKHSYGIYLDDPFLFGTAGRGDKVDPSTYRAFFAKVVEKAGLPKSVTPHAMRHRSASALIRQGSSVVAAARILGHSQSSTTLNVYSEESLAGAFDAIMTINEVTARSLT